MAEEIGYVPIQEGDKMANSEYSDEYKEEHVNMAVDNLNMLYVALTRARENVYISALCDINSKGQLTERNKHVGKYLLESTGLTTQITQPDELDTVLDMPYAEYTLGEPVIAEQKKESTGNEIELQLCSNSDRVCYDGVFFFGYGLHDEHVIGRVYHSYGNSDLSCKSRRGS